eukprot:13381683-Heterocapsa_arctica.AAC.1
MNGLACIQISPTVTSALTIKRVRWLRSIMQHLEQHTMLLAAVIGFPSMSSDRAPLSSRGHPTQYASPWLRLWWHDLEQVAQQEPILRQEILRNGMFALRHSDAFHQFSVELLPNT